MMSADFLQQIMKDKRARLCQGRAGRLDDLREQACAGREGRQSFRLRAALNEGEGLKVIAEIKRASPSKGAILVDADPSRIARAYAAGGAAGISVLTEERHFRGSLQDLLLVREAVTLPILRKDFVFDESQVYETAIAGADAVLLIVAALDRRSLRRLIRIIEEELNMDSLVEVHTAAEMEIARNCGATLLGVNNRNLRTFQVSLDVSTEIGQMSRPGETLVSESGLRTNEDLRRLRELGYKGFLIGEALMISSNPEQRLRSLIE